MAENSYQNAVQNAKSAIKEISDKVKELDKDLLDIIKNLKEYGSYKIPSDVAKALKEQADKMEALNEIIKKQEQQIKKLIDKKKNLKKLTLEEKVVKQELTSQMRQEIKAVNEVMGSYANLIAKQKIEKKLLMDLKANTNATAQEIQNAESAYKNTSAAIDKINTEVKELTANKKKAHEISVQERVEAQQLAAKKRLEAKATSEVAGAYQQLLAKKEIAKQKYQALIVEGRKAGETQKEYNKRLREAKNEFDTLSGKVKKAQNAVKDFSSASKRGLRGMFSGLKNLIGAFGVIGGATLFANATREAFKLIKTLDALNFAMRAVIKDAEELGQTQEWLKEITNKYGAELVSTTTRYIKFRAAAQQANMSAEETQKIFGTMTKAAGVLGLKTDELTGIYLALEQMISKGKITTEELRRQLGERLPGAMDIMADAMGVTTAELDTMMKKGEVITKDVLPAFAEQVEIAFGIESVEKVETLQAASTRLQNSWTLLVEDFNKSNNTSKALIKTFDFLAKNLGGIFSLGTKVVKMFVLWKASVVASTLATNIMSGALKKKVLSLIATRQATFEATVATRGFTAALLTNPLTIFVAALGFLLVAFRDTGDEAANTTAELIKNSEEATKNAESVKKATDENEKLYERYKELTTQTPKNTKEQKELETIISKLGRNIPSAVTEVDRYTNTIKLNTKAIEDNIAANNIKVGTDAAARVDAQKKALEEATREQEEFNNLLERGASRLIEIEGERFFFRKRNGKIEAFYRDEEKRGWDELDEKTSAIFKREQARLKDNVESIKENITANQLLAFSSIGAYESETQAIRDSKAAEDEKRKAQEEEFDNSFKVANLKKEIADAERAYNKVLFGEELDQIEITEEAQIKAIDNIKEKDVEAYQEARKLLEQRKKDLKDFTGLDPEQMAKEEEAERKRQAREYAKWQKQKLAADKKALKDQHDINKMILKAKKDAAKEEALVNINKNKEILENEEATLKEKLKALDDWRSYSDINARDQMLFEKKLAREDIEYKKSLSRLEISDKEALAKRLKELDDLLFIQLKASQDKYRALIVKNRTSQQNQLEGVIKSEFEKKKLEIEEEVRLEQEKWNWLEDQANEGFNNRIAYLKRQREKGLLSQREYDRLFAEAVEEREKRIQKILRQSAIEKMKIELDLLEQLKESKQFTSPEDAVAIDLAIARLKRNISKATSEAAIADQEDEAAARLKKEELIRDTIKQTSQVLADALGMNADNIQAMFDRIQEGIGNSTEEILAFTGMVGQVATDAFLAHHDRQIEKLEEAKQANNDYYAAILENEELTEQQRSALEAQRDAKNAEIDKKQRKERTKKAKVEKANAIFQVGIQTAIAMQKSVAISPATAGEPFKTIAAVLGALQIAAIISKPIPKYEKGTMDAPGGWALVDEKRPEVHTDKQGNIKSFGSETGANLRYLEKGDKIYKSRQEFLSSDQDTINDVVWNINSMSNGISFSKSDFDSLLVSEMSGMRRDMKIMTSKFEKIAKRPIQNKVTVELEDNKAY